MSGPKKQPAWALLNHPVLILVSILIGIFIGLFSKRISSLLAPIGEMYLYFIQMCVIPILIAAIVSSIAKIIRTREGRESFKTIALVFTFGLLAASLVGTIAGVAGKPGVLGQEKVAELGRIIKDSAYPVDMEISLSEPPVEADEDAGFLDFFVNMIPSNIFSALSSGRALEIVFFSIIFGIAAGFTPPETSDFIITLSSSLFVAFQVIIKWAMYGLFIGLICLISDQVASVGLPILTAALKFILIFYLSGLFFICVCILLIWKKSGERLSTAVKAISEPVIIALATRSSFATLPASIQALEEKLGFEKTSTNLVLSLGITICRYGNILFFAVAAFFVSQLYGNALSVSDFLIIIVGSVFAGTATAGASGMVTLSMIGIVLSPLGLPVEAVLVIFMAVDPIVDPWRTLLIVLGNITATMFVAEKQSVSAEDGAPLWRNSGFESA